MLYSTYLHFAKPFDGALATIQDFQEIGFTVNIVSHKTKFPYVGKSVNLHDKSYEWIAKNLVSRTNQPLLEDKQIMFTENVEKKVSTILKIGVMIFIDDLKHVLDKLPDHIEKIWFNPEKNDANSSSYKNWSEIRNKIWQTKTI